MGAQDELKAARWTSALPVSGGPGLNDLEAVIQLITDITVATQITGTLGLNEKCAFTDPIRSRGANTPGTVGLRLRDTTTSLEWLIQNIAGNLKFYNNTGTEDSPSWQFQGQIPLQCICHVEELDAHTVGSSGYTVSWDGVVVEDISTMWAAGAPTRIVIPFSGYYRVLAYAYTNANPTFTGWTWCGIKLNGGASAITASNRTAYHVTTGTSPSPSWQTEIYSSFSASDYLEFVLAAQSNITVTRFYMIVERLR